MSSFKYIDTLVRVYTIAALVTATVLSPLSSSFIPVILLVWYLYQWRWPISAMIDLVTQFFVYFTVSVLFSAFFPPWLALLPALPILISITSSLEKTAAKARLRKIKHHFSLTPSAVTFLSITGGVLLISVIVANLTLILTCAVLIVYFLALGFIIYRNFPAKPVIEDQIQARIIAGKEEALQISYRRKTPVGGLFFVESSQSWIKAVGSSFSLKQKEGVIKIVITPSLSGPTTVKLDGYAADRWGLFETRFEIEPVKLVVVPRARYATWLAQKYIAGTRPGALPLLASLGAVKSMQGLRQGVEYYGNRQYQAGDSLKNIDWKHTAKYNELITKEFTEFQGQPAIVLLNLEAGNAEEADKLAYNLIITALTLSQDNIPAALAAYDHEKVVMTTTVLSGGQLVLRSMQIVKEITTTVNPVRYLNPPDIIKLKSNIRRLKQSGSKAAVSLAGLLQLEYKNLSGNARQSPCTQALSDVIAKVNESSSIIVLSCRNHDAEALALNTLLQSQKGNAVINIA